MPSKKDRSWKSPIDHTPCLRLAQRGPQRKRKPRGSQLAEFGPALALLFGLVILPLLDLSVIPLRWIFAQNLVNDYTRQLALCESFSQSKARMDAVPSLAKQIENIGGIKTKTVDLHLKISNAANTVMLSGPGDVPPEWLPNGANAPCCYSLELRISALMSPAFVLPAWGPSIPGLNAPVPILISSAHEWENLGRDPRTRQFFINE